MAEAATTTTTLTELSNSEVINEFVLDYAVDFSVAAPYAYLKDLRGLASKVAAFPKWILDAHEDVANETTDLTIEDLETTEVTITAAEIGLRRGITDAALEETIIGRNLFDFVVRDAAAIFATALDDDIVALFGSFSTSVGTSGSNITIANMVEAQAQIRKNKMRGKLVYVLDDQQASDYQAAQAAATAVTSESFFTISTGVENAYLGTFMGHPVWQTGLCDTANTAADVVGACFIDGRQSPTAAAIGMVITRDIRTEFERDTISRLTEVCSTAKWGVGEISDLSGTAIITDA